MYFPTRTEFTHWGNHPPAWVIGQVRRLADEFGHSATKAKKGQYNDVVLDKGYLRLKWPTRKLAKIFKASAKEMYGHRTSTRCFKNPNLILNKSKRG